MFHGLIELIKETRPEILKRVMLELIEGYTEIESVVSNHMLEINKTLSKGKDGEFFNILNSISKYEEITKIDGKIELLEELEEWLETGCYEPIPVTENVIDVMILDYKNRLNDSVSETLKMYYGIKIDTLNELKKYL